MSVSSKAPVRILLTVPHLNRTASPYRETMAFAKYLPSAEFHLTICALRDGGFFETAPILQDIGVPCFVAAFRPTGHSLRHFVASFRQQKEISLHGPFDIQHSMDFTSSPFEAVMARLRSRLFVYSQRNLNENGHKVLLKIKTVCAQRIITISGTVSKFMLSEGVNSRIIREIFLGLDLDSGERTHVASAAEYPYILFVGQFERRKRHQDAILAFALIQGEFPTLGLNFVGNVFDEVYLCELRDLVKYLGLAERIHFLGPRADVLDLMRNASALLLCSASEAFGWVLIEAMSVGLPIVCSAVDGPCELVEHEKNGLLVPVGDIEGYAHQLRRLMRDSNLRSALSANGLRSVSEKYSAVAMIRKIQDVYRELLASRAT